MFLKIPYSTCITGIELSEHVYHMNFVCEHDNVVISAIYCNCMPFMYLFNVTNSNLEKIS